VPDLGYQILLGDDVAGIGVAGISKKNKVTTTPGF
jgi:hypothetical protein